MLIPDIYIRKLSLTYEQVLFDRLDLTVPAGEWLCLLGGSGVGKSTLLRLIAGLTPCPDNSIDTSDQRPLTNRISYMAQQDCLLPWLSVFNNVLMSYRLRGIKITEEHRQCAQQLLVKAGLGNALKQHINQLSGGMRQRAALVRTLLDDKPIVLMDEPFSALDTLTRFKLQTLAAELLTQRTVIMVTHDPLEALRLADKIFVMHGQPAQLSHAITPSEQRPRQVDSPAILQQQAQLLNLLKQESSC